MPDPDPGSPAGVALASEFPPADRAAWETLAGDLDRLHTTTYDDITIAPLYTSDDGVAEVAIGLPGTGTRVRGRTATAARHTGWDVRQVVDGAAPSGRAREELERGATSLWLELRAVDDVGAAVERALDGVLLDIAPVVLAAGHRWSDAAAALAARWQAAGLAAAGGSLGADPYGDWASDRTGVDIDGELAAAVTWAARLAAESPQVKTVTIDGTRYHDAGASDGQELALTVAAAVATVRAFDEAGVAEPFAAIELRVAATADQFATIAKIRAVRELWSRVATVAGAPHAAGSAPVHAVTSSAMMTRYDPAVNMVRATVACFAAGVAGADAVTVVPYDAFVGDAPSELGRRLARNTQSVLALESNLAKVIDPAGGSWYVERLTAELADVAWTGFQEIEAAGGFPAAIAAGSVGERVAATRARRDDDVDRRRAPITGVSAFADVAEPSPPPAPGGISAGTGVDLERTRWAERFEALRQRVDASAAVRGSRPVVYLATLGTPDDFAGRLTFAQNLFAIAGLATVSGPPEGFAASDATVACVCSSDAVYRDEADDAVAALVASGASRVDVAGRDPIVAGASALTVLRSLVDDLGVA